MKILGLKVFRDCLFIISHLEKKLGFYLLIGLIVLCGIFETLGVLMLAPLAQNLLGEGSENYINKIVQDISAFSELEFFTAFLIMFGIVYLIKAILLSLLVFFQSKFAYECQRDLSNDLLGNFSLRPFSFHMNTNSSELIRTVVSDVNLLTHTGITNLIILLSELFVLIGIITLLFSYDTKVAFSIFSIMGLAAIFIILITKNKLVEWGERRVESDGNRLKMVQEILGGIRNIKLSQNLNFFIERYKEHNATFSLSGRHQAFLQLIPRIWFELILITLLISIAGYFTIQGFNAYEIIPLFALYAGAGFRILPSISRIVASNQSLRFTSPVAEQLTDLIKEIEINNHKDNDEGSGFLEFHKEIEFDSVSFSYSDEKDRIIKDIDLCIPKGSLIGIYGQSGSGKTTFFDLLTGLIEPTAGKITIDGVNLKDAIEDWQKKIAYVEQIIFLSDFSIAENIAFGEVFEEIDLQKVEKACEETELSAFIKDLPGGLSEKVGERGIMLSGGQLQRIGIARALYRDPEVLVLDEITSSLDSGNEASIMQIIQSLKSKKTVFMISHKPELFKNFDIIFELKAGKLIRK